MQNNVRRVNKEAVVWRRIAKRRAVMRKQEREFAFALGIVRDVTARVTYKT